MYSITLKYMNGVSTHTIRIVALIDFVVRIPYVRTFEQRMQLQVCKDCFNFDAILFLMF